jgi:hypothetical protein
MRKAKATISAAPAETAPLILTVGHSTRPIEEFISLLQAHGATCVVDVRTIPRSRHNPQFNADSLPHSLKKADIDYVHLSVLGGLRRTSAASPNTGWRNASFRGFADYMQTPEFERGLNELLQLARGEQVVLMCAEAVPWRCHRSLISDALLARGIRAEHVMSPTNRHAHKLTPFARVRGTQVTYPPEGVVSNRGVSQKNLPNPGKGSSKTRKKLKISARDRLEPELQTVSPSQSARRRGSRIRSNSRRSS